MFFSSYWSSFVPLLKMSSSMLSALCKNAWFGSTDQAVAAGISWQAHMDSCHMVGTGIIPSIKSKEIASFFKSTPLPHLYLFLSYSFFPAFAPLQTKLFPRPEITWSLCRSDSRVCEDEILWLFFFPPLASTSLNALVAQTGVVSHQLRHISVKQKTAIHWENGHTLQDGAGERWKQFWH